MASPIRLGAFFLQEPIGQGGMGEVWRGFHLAQRTPVAVKVLVSDRAREERALAAFRREVRAVAALNHPAIVAVFDHGVISDQAAEASNGRLVEGSPYMVMELADATLAREPPKADWAEIVRVLHSLLDALAHAHARGIVHRDLKPANVLWVRRGEGYPSRLKLSDFGLAHAIVENEGDGRTRGAGTPAYMAPEQFRGATRDFGPWTDLYALGCLAYQAVSGRRPFEARDDEGFARQHLESVPEPPPVRCPVPVGFVEWLMKLLEKSPRKRFRLAADARWALERLGEPDPAQVVVAAPRAPAAPLDATLLDDDSSGVRESVVPAGPDQSGEMHAVVTPSGAEGYDGDFPFEPPKEGDLATQTVSDLPVLPTVVTESTQPALVTTDAPAALTAPSAPAELPPMPATWRSADDDVPPPPLAGVGLGLVGWKSHAFVGREAERDVLWSMLAEVRSQRRPSAVVLRGPSGYGKTRLSEWFAERAHETGAAHVLVVEHEEHSRPGDPIARMVGRTLGISGLERRLAKNRVERQLAAFGIRDEIEADGLVDIAIRPTGEDAPRAAAPTARRAFLTRFLERASEGRALVVRVEDAHFADEAVSLAEHVLGLDAALPVLFVLTVRDEALAARSSLSDRLGRMLKLPRARSLVIGPLPARDHGRLVASLLHFEGELADRIAQRTAGNPLFAVQLVRDWVQRGVLETAQAGFRLREGVSASLPDDLYAVWTAHVDRVVGDDPNARTALELAAVAGRRIDIDEWSMACDAAGLEVPVELLDRMLAQRLVVPDDDGRPGPSEAFRFVHGMLRECVERVAEEGGRLPDLHSAVAESLLPRYHAGDVEVAERLGLHLRKAGRGAAALAPLRAAVRLWKDRSEYDRATSLLELHASTLVYVNIPDSDPEWVESLRMRAELLWRQGSIERAAEIASSALDTARLYDHEALIAETEYLVGYLALHQGRLFDAEASITGAMQRFELGREPLGAARCLRALATIAMRRGNPKFAFQASLNALELCRQHDDVLGMAAALNGMGTANPGDHTAAGHLEEALMLFEGAGDLFGVAATLNNLGEAARKAGKAAEAEVLYRRATRLAQQVGATFLQATADANLGFVLVERGQYAEALRGLDVAWRLAERLGQRSLSLAIHIACLPCCAAAKAFEDFDVHCDQASETMPFVEHGEVDLARAAELAGDLCSAAGDRNRARSAWSLAQIEWKRVDQPERAAAIDEKIDQSRDGDRPLA